MRVSKNVIYNRGTPAAVCLLASRKTVGLVWLTVARPKRGQPHDSSQRGRGRDGLRAGPRGPSERAVPRLAMGFSSAPTISITQMGPR